MEPAGSGLTPAHITTPDSLAPSTGIPDSVHLGGKIKDLNLESIVKEEPSGTFSVLKDGIPPYQAIQGAVKRVIGQDVNEGRISDIHGTFETDNNNGVVAETFKRDGREFIKFSVTWNVTVHTDEGAQVIKVRQNVYTGVEVPPLTSDNADYDPVLALEEAKNKAYLLAKSYELIQRVGTSAVGGGDINQKIRNCANLTLKPVGNPSTLRQDEPFAAQHNFRQLRVSLPDGGLVDSVLDLGERFYENYNKLHPASFLKEIAGQFIVLKTSTTGVSDFEEMELSGVAPRSEVIDNPALKAKYIKFLHDKNAAYLKEENSLTAALSTLMGKSSPLLTRLQDPAVSQLVDDYVKARKDYASIRDDYKAAKGMLSTVLIDSFNQAQKLRDQKAKELKQLTGLGALGMIATRLQTLNSRLEKNTDTLATLGERVEQEIEKTDELTERLKAQIREFKDREIGFLKLKILLTQVEGPEAQETVNSLLAAAALGESVGTDFESILPSVKALDEPQEGITDAFDVLNLGRDVEEPDAEATAPKPQETVDSASGGKMIAVAKSTYSAVSSLFTIVGSGIRQLTQSMDWQDLEEASEIVKFGEVISPRDQTPLL